MTLPPAEPNAGEDDLPERTCILTRVKRDPAEMLRFALAPDGTVTPDLKGKLPGRGAWVTADRSSIEQAVKKRLFARAFKAETQEASGLADLVDRLLEADALSALALCNKAGAVVTGFFKVETAIAAGKARVFLHATDGAADGLRKLKQVIARGQGGALETPPISLFSTAQMSLCLGRENVIHASLSGASVTERFVEKCRRLIKYRAGVTSEPGLASIAGSETGPSFI
jgi:uncharacterized protein